MPSRRPPPPWRISAKVILRKTGVYISVRKRCSLFPLLQKIFFAPLATHSFSTPLGGLFALIFPILHLFYPAFYFPFSHFFPFLPFLHFPPFSLPLSIFFPQMTSAEIPPGEGGKGGIFSNIYTPAENYEKGKE